MTAVSSRLEELIAHPETMEAFVEHARGLVSWLRSRTDEVDLFSVGTPPIEPAALSLEDLAYGDVPLLGGGHHAC